MNRLAIFDCDGTLVDSGATIHRALDRALNAHGVDCPPPHIARKVIGLSLEQAVAELVPDGDIAAISRTYRDTFIAMRSDGEVDEPLFEGIAALVEAFQSQGWLLGVATGKSRRGLDHCLRSHGLGDSFVSLQTADTNRSKPHPDMALTAMAEAGSTPATTVFIGDTAWDMGCARSAGCGAIGAGWGYHDEAELIAAGAHGVAQDPSEVLAMAQTWVDA